MTCAPAGARAIHLGLDLSEGLALLLGCAMSGCAPDRVTRRVRRARREPPAARAARPARAAAGRRAAPGRRGRREPARRERAARRARPAPPAVGAAGTGGSAGTTGAAGAGAAGTTGSAGSGPGTGGRGGSAVAGRGGAGGDGGSAGGPGTAGRRRRGRPAAAGRPGRERRARVPAVAPVAPVDRAPRCPARAAARAPTLKNSPTTAISYNMVTTGGMNRRYILRYPSNYDNTHPYRLVLAYHWNTGSASQVFDCNHGVDQVLHDAEPVLRAVEPVEQQHDLHGARRAQRRLGQQQWPGRHLHRRHPQTGRGRSLHRQVADLRQRVQLWRGHVVRARLCSSGCFPGRRDLLWWAAQRLQRRQLAGGVLRHARGGRRNAQDLRRTHHARQVREEQRLHRHESARAGQQQRLAHLHFLPRDARLGTPSAGARSMAATVTTRRPRTQASP